MKIHEYQAKTLFADYGIPVQQGFLCYNIKEILNTYSQLGSQKAVIKAQVLTGGRGKAGGVKLVQSANEMEAIAEEILGMEIKGYRVDRVLVCEAVAIASEYYLSFVIDRNTKSVILIVSREGGMDIEQVALQTPELIFRFVIDSTMGVPDFLARRAAFVLFDDINAVKQTASLIQNLYRLFIETDASLAEINPLVLTEEGKILAIDAKMVFDNNALFRHPGIRVLFEPTEAEKKEQYAKSKGFSYIELDGNIGCMVNGAGLAMATMDVIQYNGGRPANFLDIGGSSNSAKVVEAMKLLLNDSRVQVVLINIFGGITRCDDVAIGLLEAFKQIETTIPLVIRLTGTNEKEGRDLLRDSPFHLAETMDEATQLVLKLLLINK